MNASNFSLEQLRQDVRNYVSTYGNTIQKLAKASGVDWAVLHRFLHTPGAGVSGATVEKLYPVLYQANHVPLSPAQDPPEAA